MCVLRFIGLRNAREKNGGRTLNHLGFPAEFEFVGRERSGELRSVRPTALGDTLDLFRVVPARRREEYNHNSRIRFRM